LNRRDFLSRAPGVTENGCAYLDRPREHGRVRDDRRIEFLPGYLPRRHPAGSSVLSV
jgi:hypothetical protein